MRGKTLYVFGDPLATVLSLVERTSRDGQVWLNSHAQHLKAPETTPSDLLQNDSLGLFAHLKAWVEDKNHPALFVRYEELWSVVDQVADYIGMAIELPARKRRTVDRLEAPRETKLAYGEFSEYVASLPDYFVTGEAPPRVTQL